MKKLILAALILISFQTLAQHRVEIIFKGIEEVKGTVLVAVYNTEESFMKKHILSAKQKVSGKQVTVVLENVKPGEYGISAFHDENDNDKLDTNFVGIPKELYGFSNDAKGSFGPPAFEKAKVKITGETKLVINLK